MARVSTHCRIRRQGTYQIQVMTLHVQDDARSVLALDPSLDVSQYAHTAWTIRDGITRGAVYPIAQTPDGYLWLGANFGLLCFDGVRAHHRSRRRIDSLKESSDE